VSQKQFMRPLMMAAWASHTHLESAAVALLASRGMHPQSWTGASLHYIAYRKRAGGTYHQALEGDRDIRKTVGLRLYLMMERISTWMAAGTGAGLLFWVTKTMAVGDCCR
jgi:hypothetical protein